MITRESLLNDLADLGIRRDGTLLVHSSMKMIGPVAGGADTVLDVLQEYMRPGLLVFPALSYNLNSENPLFREKETPAIVGILPELFRKRPGVFRSLHPTHSVAASGEGAAEFVAGHETFDSPCAPASPWGKLLERRAQILFIGTGIGCNTYFHGVEEMAKVPGMLTEEPEPLAVITVAGRRIEVPSRRHVGDHSRFYAKTEPILAGQGALGYGCLGDAACQVLDTVRATEVVLELLRQEPNYFTHPDCIVLPMDAAWSFLWSRLFCCKTRLFYDYLGPGKGSERFAHLPSPEEIVLQFPNPCGWGTGMEDCMLNAGTMLDVLHWRQKRRSEDHAALAAMLVDGIHRCARVHGKTGFLVRGITPRDGQSCYFNTSRDQLTLAVYGLWRFFVGYRTQAPTRSLQQAHDVLVAIARYCEDNLSEENQFDFRRLDGGRAIVSTLWNCDAHEMLRLPMIYAAAYLVSEEKHFLKQAERYLEPGLNASEQIDPAIYWWDIPLVQMQISVRLLLESNLFPEQKNRFIALMVKVAGIAEKELAPLLADAEAFSGDWGVFNADWREQPMKATGATLGLHNAVYDGRTYLNPVFPPGYQEPYGLQRGIGNYLAAMLLVPEYQLSQDTERRFNRLLNCIDFSRSTSCAVVNLFYAHTLLTR